MAGPIVSFKDYPIDVAIWERTNEAGEISYNVSLQKSYTKPDPDNPGQRLKDDGKTLYFRTNSLTRKDLLLAAELLTQAYRRLTQIEKS